MKTFAQFSGVLAAGMVFMVGLGACNTLLSIEVSREPERTVYGQGQEIDPSGLAVTAYYKKDIKQISNPASLKISGYNKDEPGTQQVIVTLNRMSAAFTVTVAPVERISISQPPTAAIFKQGEAFDPAGLSVWAEFGNDAVPGETLGPGRLTFSGYNKDMAGIQTITADYYGKWASFDVKVAGLMGIAVASPPDKTEYFTGEDLDLEGLVVNGMWEGMKDAPVKVTKENISGFDLTRPGVQQIVVSYSGKQTAFPVTYIALSALSVDRPPRKTDYELGEELVLDGIRVQGTWPGNSLALVDVSRLKISGYDKFRADSQKITVTVGGKSDSFMVTVSSPFEGTWTGEWGSENEKKPVELIMSKNSWLWRTTDKEGKLVEVSGAYTPDRKSHVNLQCDDRRGVGDAEMISSLVMRLTCTFLGRVTFNKTM